MARLLLKNGRVFIGRPGTGSAEAVAIAGRRVVAVGSLRKLRTWRTASRQVDLQAASPCLRFATAIHLPTGRAFWRTACRIEEPRGSRRKSRPKAQIARPDRG